ncbi:hypothetical protein EJD97_005671, partial [Solanum chilense]
RRMVARRLEEGRVEEDVPPHVEQVCQGHQGDKVRIKGQVNEFPMVPLEMTNDEVREALITLARALTTHVNMGIGPRVNVVETTMTSRLRDFVRMNPPIFLGSKVGEDPQEFLD